MTKKPAIGHNSGEPDPGVGQRLKSLIERIERLESEKQGLAEDIRDVYGEAKATGLDAKIIRKIVRLRKMDEQKRQEDADLLATYAAAIGMQLEFDV